MKLKWAVLAAYILYTPIGHAYANTICQNPSIKIAGPRQTVFHYKSDHCSQGDTPDTPAMAFKDMSGQVHLFNGIPGSYMSVGPTLNSVRRDCSKPLNNEIKPAANNTPDSFDNWKWFRSPWTDDGKTVYGLIHNEFHGWEQPQKYCPSGNQETCLYPNVTTSISTDGGKTFHVIRDKNKNIVLALVTPYAYDKEANKQAGIRAPTNIISRQENGKTYYYLLASNRGAPGVDQKAGTCLYRSDQVSDPSHWRAWDGNDFNVVVNASVYRNKDLDVQQHLCKPVFTDAPSSWSYNSVLNQYLAVVGMHKGNSDENFGYVTSQDRIHWSQAQPLMRITFSQFQKSSKGSGVSGQTYPSILDPESPGLNFEYTGAHPYLYFTRFNPKAKGETWHNRDLIRVPLEVSCQKN